MDTALPSSGARTRVLPLVGPVVADKRMAVALLRAGVLGAIRRLLQTTADGHVTPRSEDATRMRLSLFGMLKALAPSVQPAHLRQSRGLGRLLMLIAKATASEPRQMRQAAATILERMVPGGSEQQQHHEAQAGRGVVKSEGRPQQGGVTFKLGQ